MTVRLLFQDPLEWQSGLEWGVEAATILIREGYDLECVFRSHGPMLEAVAFAAFDLGILERCIFDEASLSDPSQSYIVIDSLLRPHDDQLIARSWRRKRADLPEKALAGWASSRNATTIAREFRTMISDFGHHR